MRNSTLHTSHMRYKWGIPPCTAGSSSCTPQSWCPLQWSSPLHNQVKIKTRKGKKNQLRPHPNMFMRDPGSSAENDNRSRRLGHQVRVHLTMFLNSQSDNQTSGPHTSGQYFPLFFVIKELTIWFSDSCPLNRNHTGHFKNWYLEAPKVNSYGFAFCSANEAF